MILNKIFFRTYSEHISNKNIWNVCHLRSRKLIRLSGQDSYAFLQGLFSNDVRLFLQGFQSPFTNKKNQHDFRNRSIYGFFLETNGRVFSDVLVHNVGSFTPYVPIGDLRTNAFQGDKNHILLLEVDAKLLKRVESLLKLHKIRKKINLQVEDNMQVWSVFPAKPSDEYLTEITTNELVVHRDPRLDALGYRVIAQDANLIILKLKEILANVSFKNNEEEFYIKHRYMLGVGEGLNDNPESACFPLQQNAEWLNGVSFHKGCYLGQEQTARLHHTGVVRKRLMPIQLISKILPEKIILPGMQLVKPCEPKVKLGKVIKMQDEFGLGLLYVNEVEKTNWNVYNAELKIMFKTHRPDWWPCLGLKPNVEQM